MSARRTVFLDSNILIYAYSSDEAKKHAAIQQLIKYELDIVISTQVINEFISVMRRKRSIPCPILKDTVQELASLFRISLVTLETIEQALEISQRYQYSYFDSLIISSALENSCAILYSEDMHHKHMLANGLTIINPFDVDLHNLEATNNA